MDNEPRVNTFFVSEKVSKIRWVPEQLKDCERFLTGSWDSKRNSIKLWKLEKNQYCDEYEDFIPKCNDKVAINGDISGLELLGMDNAVVSSSDGLVTIVTINRAVEEDRLRTVGTSELLHKRNSGKPSPCTGLSVFNKDIATVGEDGRLNIVSATNLRIIKTIEADSCSLNAVSYINPKEIITANRMGVMKIFDIRSDSKDPTISFMISCEDDRKSNYVSCLAYHPTQKHIVLAGSEEGSITVWDLRQPGFPASYLSAHNSAITEIGFHKSEPSKLFTASESGEVWQWTQNVMTIPNDVEPQIIRHSESDNINPWLNGERAKSRINVTSLITDLRKPINSFDSFGSKIICGSDSEAVYFINCCI